MPDPIKFYSKTTAYRELSNFAPFGFEDDGVYWPTVEHYFQVQKFPGEENVALPAGLGAWKSRLMAARSHGKRGVRGPWNTYVSPDAAWAEVRASRSLWM